VLQDFRAKKRENDKAWENWNKHEQPDREKGLNEKQAAIAKVIKELEEAEKTLIEAGAKTFDEMHPEIPKRIEHPRQVYKPSEPARYETNLSFHVPDLNDAKKDGYFRLFEATWNNDLETVKALTLAPWASMNEKPLNVPLKVAVQDGNGFSPFSIAVLRGHRDLAKKIIEICATQYHKDDGLNSRQRWQMRSGDSDEGSDDDDDENLPIFSELVSDDFTIDNLGEVSNIVKSNVLPLTMIEWNCKPQRFLKSEDVTNDQQRTLLGHAVYQDDIELLKYIIQIGAEQQALLAQEADDQKCYSVSIPVFQLAIRLGRTALLAELIKSSGAGIPFNEIIQRTGIEIKTKPRYYPG
jgi:ankyrin repeat protein